MQIEVCRRLYVGIRPWERFVEVSAAAQEERRGLER
jgi:hypothetical protein